MLKRFAVVGLGVLLAGGLQAAEKKAKAGAMEMDAAMQEMMKRGAPGEHHKALEPFAGKFTVMSRMWMKPGDAPQESRGTSEHTWVLGGRFLKMDFRGDMAGQSFEGLGYLGYDNVRGEYVSAWLDSMSTGISRSVGQFDPAAKTLKEGGSYSCVMTGEKERSFRGEWKILDADNLSYAMYHAGPDGKDFKSMEIAYRRVK